MKCCPQCEHLNESSQINCEICATKLTKEGESSRGIHLSAERTLGNLEVDKKGRVLMSLIVLIGTTILVSMSGVERNKVWSKKQESKSGFSAVVQELKGRKLMGDIGDRE